MWNNIDQDRHYPGQFQIEDETIPGEILYNKKSGIIMLSLKRKIETIGKSFGKQPYISGELNTGAVVTLFNTRCVKNHTENFSLQHLHFLADKMIFGKTEDIDPRFNKMVCTVENALAWSGLSQVEDEFDKITICGLGDVPTYNWYGVKIRFRTDLKNDFWTTPRKEECKVVERLVIEIESTEKQPVDFFIQIRNDIMALISFAIKDNINVESQSLFDYDIPCMIDPIESHREFVLITNEPYHYLLNSRQFWYNFYLNQLPIDDDLSDKLTKLKPIFNLYLSLFKYEDMPTEMVFLNIVQAIETFHSRFFYKDKKKLYVQSVYDRFEKSVHFESLKKLLLSDTQMDENCNFIILVSRLNDLLIGKYDGLFYEFYGEDSEYAQRIADTRHYYTHYGKSKEAKALKGDDLFDAIEILRLLLEYNVCLVLGIDRREQTISSLRSYFAHKQLDKHQAGF